MRDLTEQGYSAGQSLMPQKDPRFDLTLRENIDQQITHAEARVKELHETKARLEASNLLDTRIDDLTRAMRF